MQIPSKAVWSCTQLTPHHSRSLLSVSVTPPALLGIWREVVRPHTIVCMVLGCDEREKRRYTHKKSIFLQWPSAVESRKTHTQLFFKPAEISNFFSQHRTRGKYLQTTNVRQKVNSELGQHSTRTITSQPKHLCWSNLILCRVKCIRTYRSRWKVAIDQQKKKWPQPLDCETANIRSDSEFPSFATIPGIALLLFFLSPLRIEAVQSVCAQL